MAVSANETQPDIFISFAPQDKTFVRKLHESLVAYGLKTWVDWDGVPLSADWMTEITAAIEGADAFLFVISPDSLRSTVCADELAVSLKNHKKLVPILHRAPEEDNPTHEKIEAANWLFMRAEDDFEETVPQLVDAIHNDLDWVRDHTQILKWAVQWEGHGRPPHLLLHGNQLDKAKVWQTKANERPERQLTALQAEYILASRQQNNHRQRILLASVSVILIIAILLTLLPLAQWRTAVRQHNLAITAEAETNEQPVTAVTATQVQQDLALPTAQVTAEVEASQQVDITEEQQELALATAQAAAEQRQLAEEQHDMALVEKGLNQAQLLLQEDNLLLGVMLALEAYQRYPSPESAEFLRQTLPLLGKPLTAVPKPNQPVRDVLFSPDGRYLATSEGDGVTVWDSTTFEPIAHFSHDGEVTAVAFSLDGSKVATGDTAAAYVWQAETGMQTAVFPHNGRILDVAFSPDGTQLATASEDMTARLWRLETGVRLVTLPHQDRVVALAFSPDGGKLVTAGDLGLIWGIQQQTQLAVLLHNGPLLDVVFSPDGRNIVTASTDNTTRIWDANNIRLRAQLPHDGWVQDVAFSPDGQWIATASDDHTVRLWDLRGNLQHTMAHTGPVQRLLFTPDSHWLLSASTDKTARLWNVLTGQEVARLVHDEGVRKVVISPDGRIAITLSEAGKLQAWDIASHTTPLAAVTDLLSDEALITEVCARMTRNLSEEEWETYIAVAGDDNTAYRPLCPNLENPTGH